jgi:hypothetical protein
MQGETAICVDGSAICCKQLVTSLHPAFSKTGTGVDSEIGVSVYQESRLRVPIRHIEAAGRVVAVACRH